MVKEVEHQYEINPLACGQAVLSMLTGHSVNEIIELVGTEREFKLKDMKFVLDYYGIAYKNDRMQAFCSSDLPDVAILSLETPKCWHWSLYFFGTFYDPEHGVLKDFPICNRKYYWEIIKE